MNARLENRPIKVRRKGVEESPWEDVYHRLLRVSWKRFFIFNMLIYISINLVFGFAYWLAPGSVANIPAGDFFSYFSFSVQTFSTVGYGYFHPVTTTAHILVAVESAFGMFATAVLTGLVFAKFARPSARVVFSEKILWTAQNGQPVLAVRLGNVRANRVFEGRAKLTLLRDEVTTEGENIRRLVDLKLLRSETPLFALSWTVFHPIDDSSPLKGKSPEEMAALGWEIYVTFTGIDQDMAQTIVAHSTYPAKYIVRARKFTDMIELDRDVRVIDFSKLHEIDN